jgi:hypothetical protein
MWSLSEQPTRGKVITPNRGRDVPLPLACTLTLADRQYSAVYEGHGQSKVAFRLDGAGGRYDGKMLKVICPAKPDPECETMKHLAALDCDVCVSIFMEGELKYRNQVLPAWICDYAEPLDKYLQRPEADHNRCMTSKLMCILRAAESQCVVSDVGDYNFGVVPDESKVVILDMGSRGLQEERPTKGKLSTQFWSNFLKYAMASVKNEEDNTQLVTLANVYRDAWSIRDALLKLELSWMTRPCCHNREERDRADYSESSSSGGEEEPTQASKLHTPPTRAMAWDCEFYEEDEFISWYDSNEEFNESHEFTMILMSHLSTLVDARCQKPKSYG